MKIVLGIILLVGALQDEPLPFFYNIDKDFARTAYLALVCQEGTVALQQRLDNDAKLQPKDPEKMSADDRERLQGCLDTLARGGSSDLDPKLRQNLLRSLNPNRPCTKNGRILTLFEEDTREWAKQLKKSGSTEAKLRAKLIRVLKASLDDPCERVKKY